VPPGILREYAKVSYEICKMLNTTAFKEITQMMHICRSSSQENTCIMSGPKLGALGAGEGDELVARFS
jgi:hypothetical protein